MSDKEKIIELKGLIGQLDHSYVDFESFKKDFMDVSINELLDSVWEVYKITSYAWKILTDKNTEG